MNLGIRASVRQEQRMALVPSLLQSIEILQMSTLELLSAIAEESERNETLEVEEPRSVSAEAAAALSDDKQAFLLNLPQDRVDLLEQIRLQICMLDLADEVACAVLALVGKLDDRGLLTATDEQLLQDLDIDGDLLEQGLLVLRSMEPRGIGGRDPIDAMLLQLPVDDPDLADITRLLRDHLEDLGRNRIPQVSRALGRSIAELESLLSRVRTLDPAPLGRISNSPAEVVRPDVRVLLVEDEVIVEIDDLSLPDLGISRDYEGMLRDPNLDQGVQTYLRGKLQSAREIIEAVEQRKRTLARVAFTTMEHQRGFLTRGLSAIRPLQMSTVADELGLHSSTVSRAVAGKYMQTTFGIFRLRDFFDGERRDGGGSADGTGRIAIRDRVRGLISEENPRAPLSDDELVSRLAAQGIQVARRTVTKYRAEAGIPPSYRRRTHSES